MAVSVVALLGMSFVAVPTASADDGGGTSAPTSVSEICLSNYTFVRDGPCVSPPDPCQDISCPDPTLDCDVLDCAAYVDKPYLGGVECDGSGWFHQHNNNLGGGGNETVDDAWTSDLPNRGLTATKETRSTVEPATVALVVLSVVMVGVAIWAEANNEEHLHWQYECWANDIEVSGRCENGVLRKCSLEADVDGDGTPESDDGCTYALEIPYNGEEDAQCAVGVQKHYDDRKLIIEEDRGTGDYPLYVDPCIEPSAKVVNRPQYLSTLTGTAVSASWSGTECGAAVATNIDIPDN